MISEVEPESACKRNRKEEGEGCHGRVDRSSTDSNEMWSLLIADSKLSLLTATPCLSNDSRDKPIEMVQAECVKKCFRS